MPLMSTAEERSGASGPFAGLRRDYRVIAADPPWAFASNSAAKPGRNALKHYQTMSLANISALPVQKVVADDAILFLWITGPFLAIGAHIPLMKAWGFKPSGMGFVWIKLNPRAATLFVIEQDLAMGGGFTTRKNAEFCLIGKRGRSVRECASVHEVIIEPRREHSRKPEQFYDRAESMRPDLASSYSRVKGGRDGTRSGSRARSLTRPYRRTRPWHDGRSTSSSRKEHPIRFFKISKVRAGDRVQFGAGWDCITVGETRTVNNNLDADDHAQRFGTFVSITLCTWTALAVAICWKRGSIQGRQGHVDRHLCPEHDHQGRYRGQAESNTDHSQVLNVSGHVFDPKNWVYRGMLVKLDAANSILVRMPTLTSA